MVYKFRDIDYLRYNTEFIKDKKGEILVKGFGVLDRILKDSQSYVFDTLRTNFFAATSNGYSIDFYGNIWMLDKIYNNYPYWPAPLFQFVKWDGTRFEYFPIEHYDMNDSSGYNRYIAAGKESVYIVRQDKTDTIIVDQFSGDFKSFTRSKFLPEYDSYSLRYAFVINDEFNLLFETQNLYFAGSVSYFNSHYFLTKISNGKLIQRRILEGYYNYKLLRQSSNVVYIYDNSYITKITDSSITEKKLYTYGSNLFLDTSGAVMMYSNHNNCLIKISDLPGFR